MRRNFALFPFPSVSFLLICESQQLTTMEETIIEFKVKLLEDIGEKVIEVRRFNVLSAISTEFGKIKSEVVGIFPNLKNYADFVISWKDGDGDMIRVNSDEELKIAISKMSNGIIFYVKPIKSKTFVAGANKEYAAKLVINVSDLMARPVTESRTVTSFVPSGSARSFHIPPAQPSPKNLFRQGSPNVEARYVVDVNGEIVHGT